jgi:hypothetical protein
MRVSFQLFCALFCSCSSCKCLFPFSPFFFTPSLPLFYFLFIFVLYCLTVYIFLLLFPALALSLSLFIFPISFHVLLFFILFPCFRFRVSLSDFLISCSLSFFLRCSPFHRIVFCPWFTYRPLVLLPELEMMLIIQNVETMPSLRAHECECNVVVTQKHITIYLQ